MANNILFIDTETGGIDPKQSSLLSIGLAVWSNKKIISTKELLIKHDIFKFTPQALKINKIDLSSFMEEALEPKQVVNELLNFLESNFDLTTPITLGGHNTNFDINFLKYFLNKYNIKFDKLFSHRFIDTASILKFLYYAGKIKEDLSSSDKAFKFFNIDIQNRHSALGDAIGTANLFTQLIDIL
jgi:DNA polymerase III epsilon subunit-like protein